jgi:hypothetical protein
MNTKHPMLKSSQLITVVAITVAMTSSVIVLGNVNNAMSQVDFFVQPVTVNIDKTDQVLGNYGLVIRNMDNGNHVENLYSDSFSSPRNVVIDTSISVHDGDRLLACVVKMNTKDMACDMQTAHYGQTTTEFFVDMNTASQITQQNNDGNQQGGVDQFNPNSSSNATNTNNSSSSFSGPSTFVSTTMTQTSSGQNMKAGPVAGANITHAAGPKVEHLVTSTERGSLYLAFDIGVGRPTTVTFLDPTNNRTVSSVDYDIVITAANTSRIVYKASEHAGQADKPLREENGFVSIPVESFVPGTYEVTVSIYAVGGIPLTTVDLGGAFIYHRVI